MSKVKEKTRLWWICPKSNVAKQAFKTAQPGQMRAVIVVQCRLCSLAAGATCEVFIEQAVLRIQCSNCRLVSAPDTINSDTSRSHKIVLLCILKICSILLNFRKPVKRHKVV